MGTGFDPRNDTSLPARGHRLRRRQPGRHDHLQPRELPRPSRRLLPRHLEPVLEQLHLRADPRRPRSGDRLRLPADLRLPHRRPGRLDRSSRHRRRVGRRRAGRPAAPGPRLADQRRRAPDARERRRATGEQAGVGTSLLVRDSELVSTFGETAVAIDLEAVADARLAGVAVRGFLTDLATAQSSAVSVARSELRLVTTDAGSTVRGGRPCRSRPQTPATRGS